MNYEGKLYGKVGGVYFETGKTSSDFDGLLESLKWALNNLNNYDTPSESDIEMYKKALEVIKKSTR